MVWKGVSAKGKTKLRNINGTLNIHKYIFSLEKYLLPFAYTKQELFKSDFVFVQDNAATHTAKYCKYRCKRMKMSMMPWLFFLHIRTFLFWTRLRKLLPV